MAKVGISEAAQLVGKSRQTLYRLMDQGKLAFDSELIVGRTGEGGKDDYSRVIDTTELQRVFGPLLPVDSNADSNKLHHETVKSDSDVKVLEAELKATREALRKAEAYEEWLKKQCEELSVKLIVHKEPAQPTPDPAIAARIAELESKSQEYDDATRKFKENEEMLLARAAELESARKELEAERKSLQSQLLREKTKTWWDKIRGR